MRAARSATLLLALVLALAAGDAARAQSTPTPAAYAASLGGGFSAGWFSTRGGPARYRHATAVAVAARGFRNLRLPVRADRFQTAHDLDTLAAVVDDIASTGLRVVVSWTDPAAERHPTRARRAAYVSWWRAVARRLRDRPAAVSLMLFGDLDGRGLAGPATYGDWTRAGLRAIRATNRTRIVIVPAPRQSPGSLARVLRTDRHVLAEWHRWPSGPTHRRGAAQWVGDGGRGHGRTQVARAVRQARAHAPTYLGSWSPLDRRAGALTPAESVQFARYLRGRLAAAQIPWSVTRLDDYYDEAHGAWRSGAAVDGVLGALAGTGAQPQPGRGASPPPPPPPPPPAPPPAPLTAVQVDRIELAQTHVLPAQGRSWTLLNGPTVTAQRELHFVGGRPALALVRLTTTGTSDPRLVGTIGATALGSVALADPSALPPTEDAGPAYGTDLFSAQIPAAWMQPGLELAVSADGHATSSATSVNVGADPRFSVRVLPFYVFGATEQNTRPLSQVGAPAAAALGEMDAVWPVAALQVANHPAHKAVFPTLVVGPRSDSGGTPQPAYTAHNSGEYKDGFAGLSAVHAILGQLREANGEGPLDVQYYAPLLALNAGGTYAGAGGGLGGGSVGVGDDSYSGIFIHEQGHAFGLPHAGEAFDAHTYPYEWGSLNGSAWGYDQTTARFLAPFIPTSASTYSGCAADVFAGHPRAMAGGRCIKQDPMQSGAGDQSSGERFATFSDYSTAVMQAYFETKIEPDASFPGGYKRWNATTRRYDDVDTATTGNAQGGFDKGLPVQRDVPVAAVVFTISNAGTAGATQIYPPLTFTGNLVTTIDPTNAADRARVNPSGGGDGHWYCIDSGCDYTLRVTYADASVRNVLVKDAFRPFNNPGGAPSASAADPLNGASFKTAAVNVPADKPIATVQLLSTPQGYNGLPGTPAVLAHYP